MFYRELNFADLSAFLPLGKTLITDNTILSLPWCDSGFAFDFTGTGFLLHFSDYSDAAVVYLRIWVDGHSNRFAIANGKETVIVEDLIDGPHHVRVLRVTEGMEALGVTQLTLCGENPTLLERPAERPLRLAFIGDSITCGYGVVGPSSVKTYRTFEQDSSRSYAYRTAELLDAEVQLSGASGKGILANCNGDRSDLTLRQAFQWQTPKGGQWDHSQWIPDLTVINAGTNDAWGGITDEEFIPVAKQLLQEIRAAYPARPILWVYGVMDTSKKSAVERAVTEFDQSFGRAYYLAVDSMYQIPDEVGAGGHPNTNTSERVSALLAEKIQAILKE